MKFILSVCALVGAVALVPKEIERGENHSFFLLSNDYCQNEVDYWYGNDIDLASAWDISTDSTNINIGVMDQGISLSVSDLSPNVNASLGGDFFDSSRGPFSPDGDHGCMMASVIGALGNNSNTVCGVNWNASMVSLRIDDDVSSGGLAHHENIGAATAAINYADANNIPIINFSGGWNTTNNSFKNAIQNYDGLIICSAGQVNSGSGYDISNSSNTIYPAYYNYDNVLSVAGTKIDGSKMNNSFYSSTRVDLFAPGQSIRGFKRNGSVNMDSGTSFSAAITSGVAALMKSVNPSLTAAQLKSLICDNVDAVSALSGYCITGGRLNAYKAVEAAIPEYSSFGSVMAAPADLAPGREQWFKAWLTPGTYTFESTGSMDAYGKLYLTTAGSPVKQGGTGGSGSNFSFTRTFTSSRKVYLKVRNDGSSSSPFGIKITQSHTHDYTSSYVWKDYYRHYSYCSCGESVIEGHVVSSGGGVGGWKYCLLCGGRAKAGLVGDDSMADPASCPGYIPFGNGSLVLPTGVIVLSESDEELFLEGLLEIPHLHEAEEGHCHESE